VSYEVTLELGRVIACNCSICSRKGTLLAFAPASQFQLLTGEDALSDYQFGKHIIHHLFCSSCGVSSFSRGSQRDGSPMCAINVRCLQDVDLSRLEVQELDGKAL
jgi:hypothetical protein